MALKIRFRLTIDAYVDDVEAMQESAYQSGRQFEAQIEATTGDSVEPNVSDGALISPESALLTLVGSQIEAIPGVRNIDIVDGQVNPAEQV